MARKTSPSKRPGHRSARRSKSAPSSASELPSKEDILKFIAEATGKVGKREIARAFGIKGGARIALKRMLSDLADEGVLTSNRKEIREVGSLPAVTVLEISGQDSDGDLITEPVVWDDKEGVRPKVRLLLDGDRNETERTSFAVGDKVLSRITKLNDGNQDGIRFTAKPIKRLPRERTRPLGIFRAHPKGGGLIEPIDRRNMREWHVQKSDASDAQNGDLIRFDIMRKGRFSSPQARIVETIGNPDDQRQISLIAIHTHAIPDEFPESVCDEADNLAPPDATQRDDLTNIPLITIDPADARDHDDAVYAEPDTDPRNPGGYIVIVAIADVAHYVRSGTKLDREAQRRGNSVYFPDRVVPMLPEKISNNLCSLREAEERPCLAVRMIFDKNGKKKQHKFLRAMMRSAAKLSYQEAQAAIDGKPSKKCKPLMATALEPLWQAYDALTKARQKRSPLDLNLPERRIILNEAGHVERITVPERLTAHRLIEEFMIQANVAAAEALESRKSIVAYRTHAPPSKEKIKALHDFLETLNIKLPTEGSLRPGAFNKILAQTKNLPVTDLVNEVILRSQSQAEYNPENEGHFGLNLARYAHFTSPIRRYADLIVHRALISAFNLGEDGLDKENPIPLADICQHISDTERRAMAAERETTDRLIAAHLADRVGATFKAKVAGLTKSGLFVRLAETGADGFVPASTLDDDYYEHIEAAQALIGQKTHAAYRLGDEVEVRLVEAVPSAGALRFEMLSPGNRLNAALAKQLKSKSQRRGRPQRGPRQRRGR